MSARAFWCAALLAGLGEANVSCRDLYVCRDSPNCTAEVPNAGRGGTPGNRPAQAGAAPTVTAGSSGSVDGDAGKLVVAEAAGAAGTTETRSCNAPFENCDGTWLNGCETDLSGDAYDCGTCNSICEGVCARGSCHQPLTLTDQPINPRTRFAVTAEYLYFIWGESDGPYHLSRVSHLGESPQLVADHLPDFSEIAATREQLFLWGNGENLHSLTPGGALRDEGFRVSAVASQYGTVFVVHDGVLLQRALDSDTWQPVPALSMLDSGADLWPIDVTGDLVVLRATDNEDNARYDVLLVSDLQKTAVQPKLIASGNGVPLRIRASDEYVYWLVQSSNTSDVFELHRHSKFPNTADELVARERGVTDFALDRHFVYLARSLGLGRELEVALTGSIAEKLHLGSRFTLSYPEAVDNFLWYFDTSRARLQRVDLQLDRFL